MVKPLAPYFGVMPQITMERNNLICEIETVFSNVLLEDGIGLFEAEAIDNYADKDAVKIARGKDRAHWKSWKEIPGNVIDASFLALCFVNAKGMRFLLPAFMCHALKDYDKNNSDSIDSVIYALDRGMNAFEGNEKNLSKLQKTVVAKFLKYMVVVVGDDLVDACVASRAYENHWVKYE